jgi:two-component system response regulator RegX3
VLLDVALLVDGNLEICRQICELAEGPVVLLPSVRGARSVLVDSESDTGRDLALLRAVHSLTGRVSAVESKAKPDGAVKQETLEIGPIAIEQAKRTVYVRGQNAHISSKLEYELLLALVSPAGQIRTRDELLDGVWGDHRPEYPKTLDVHIKRLRKKLELEPRNPKLIVTVRGVGFYFDADATSHT